jgi:hypothetical protein
MLLLMYRTLPAAVTLPEDQRWRVIELSAESTAEDIAAAIKGVGDIPNVEAIPPGVVVYVCDTETCETWSTHLAVTAESA